MSNRPHPSRTGIGHADQPSREPLTIKAAAWRRRGPRPRPGRVQLVASSVLWTAGCALTALLVPGVADASTSLAAAESLDQVIDNLRTVIVGLLVGLATLFATIGGVRYILAGGDPGEVEAAKKTLRYAAIGYAIAVLAPVLVELLQKVVGEAP
ncbi:pilin [Actinomadura sp. LOL_016]|uniref:pilin n=2 Tax=unclassified Actinomadura TaxID=2626254 RepID=UPI003A892927